MFSFLRAFRPFASLSPATGARIIFQEPALGLKDRTGYLSLNAQFSWTLTRGNIGTANLTFDVPQGDTFAPRDRWPFWIYEINRTLARSSCVWVGTIDTTQINWHCGNDGQHLIQVQGQSIEQTLEAVQVPVMSFTNTMSGDIIAAVFGAVSGLLPIPVTLGTIDPGVLIADQKYDGKTSAWQAISQLATSAQQIAYIDPSDQRLYSHPRSARAGAFTIINGMMLMDSIQWTQKASDFRDRQSIQLDPNVVPLEIAVFPGDGSTSAFTLPKPASDVVSASVIKGTENIQASASGLFSGQPLPGDTFTVAGSVYTFVSAVDNIAFGQVLIDSTAELTCANTVAAITAGAGAGTKYSLPTWTNQQVSAAFPFGSPALQFAVAAKVLGTAGNSIALGSSSGAFAWSNPTLGTAEDLSGLSLRVGPSGSGSFDLSYSLGSDTVGVAVPHKTGSSLVVQYRATGSDIITVANGAAGSLGIGTNYQIMTAKGAKTLEAALAQATAALTAYSVLPAEVTFQMDVPGLGIGQYVDIDISVPAEAGGLLNGHWIVQQISGSMIPGMLKQAEPYGHFRYTVELINSTEVATPADTLNRLADTGPNTPPPTTNPSQPPGGGAPGEAFQPRERTFTLFDLTVRDDCGPHAIITTPITTLTSPPSHEVMNGLRIVASLSRALGADLTVRFDKQTLTSPPTIMSWEVTVPSGTPVDFPLEYPIDGQFFDLDTVTPNVTASDGATSDLGICEFVLEYQ